MMLPPASRTLTGQSYMKYKHIEMFVQPALLKRGSNSNNNNTLYYVCFCKQDQLLQHKGAAWGAWRAWCRIKSMLNRLQISNKVKFCTVCTIKNANYLHNLEEKNWEKLKKSVRNDLKRILIIFQQLFLIFAKYNNKSGGAHSLQ